MVIKREFLPTAKPEEPKDYPLNVQRGGGPVHREYEQDGWIWQAEEVRKGERWERFFGFVGPHGIARVPAAEIELHAGRLNPRWISLPSGLDARVETVEPPRTRYEPGKAVRAILRLRNRRGVENAAPTEFLRQGVDGQTVLRRGVAIAVFYSAPSRTRTDLFSAPPQDALKPKRPKRFTPGEASRPLAPFEAFEVVRLDLNDWFDLTKPGSYRVHVVFAADSGVGKGTSNDWYFTVGDGEGPVP